VGDSGISCETAIVLSAPIDFAAEEGWQGPIGDPVSGYFFFKLYNYIQRKIEDDFTRRQKIMADVASVTDGSELVRTCRRAWLDNGGCRLALQCAQLLRKRGLSAEAAWYENMVANWAVNFVGSATSAYWYWAQWQVVDIYNGECGCEDETLFWGKPLMGVKELSSTHYMVAHAYLRQDRCADAAWALMRGKALKDDNDLFCTPDGIFRGTEPYVAALMKMLDARKDLSPEWKKSIHETFSTPFLKGFGDRPDQPPVLPLKP